MEDTSVQKASGMVAVVGRANVGKSSLVNAIMEEKISIVTPVEQTTRNLIRAIYTEPRGQLVFLDTPGIHKAGNDLGRIMNRSARKAVEGVDAVLLVVDRSSPPAIEDEGWLQKLAESETPVIIAMNKTDKPDSCEHVYRALAEKTLTKEPPRWFEVSAITRDGVDRLLAALFSLMPTGPMLFPADIATDFPKKWTLADILREKLFLKLHSELPHDIAVQVHDIVERDERGWFVSAAVYVQRNSQKRIVIGEKGRLLRAVKRAAGKEAENIYGIPVQWDIVVKVEKHWERNFWMMKNLGYHE